MAVPAAGAEEGGARAVDDGLNALRDDKPPEPKPETKGPARKAYPTATAPKPSIPFPGDLPRSEPPGPGWERKGKLPVGGGQGNWYNPSTGESLYDDMQSTEHGPHWHYRQKGESGKWCWYPDGRMEHQE